MPMDDPNNSGKNKRQVPTPAEISEECRLIRDGWDATTEAGRRNFTIRKPVGSKRFTPYSGGQDPPYEFPTGYS